MNRPSVEVAVIGAGPYGLSVAAHLKQRGVAHRIFGPPMQAWQNMSPGMYLKSLGFATSITTPDRHATLDEFCRARGLEDYEPIEIATFAAYGKWVQQRLVPHVEQALVTELSKSGDQFAVTLETGEHLQARRVVVAIGLSYFERIPEEYAGLSPSLVSHTAQHGDFSLFTGRDLTVIGAGQSALQAAALAHEHGARVRLIAREDVHWGSHVPKGAKRSLLQRMKLPSTVLGHGRENWVLQHAPMAMHYMQTEKRVDFTRKHLGPGGAWWLRQRVEGMFPIHQQTSVLEAAAADGKVCLRIAEAGGAAREILTDHVIVGTGYEVDVDKIAFIAKDLARVIQRTERAPKLSRHFESSVPGLYFVGPASAYSFGPLFRFVAGTAYTAPLVARHLAWSTAPFRAALRLPVSANAISPVNAVHASGDAKHLTDVQ